MAAENDDWPVEEHMAAENDDWPEEPQPTDDERALRARPDPGRASWGARDFVAAVEIQDAAWWAALSDDDYAYGMRRALESAGARGAPLHLARCVHHLHDLLGGLDAADRSWVLALLRRIQERLAGRATGDRATGDGTGHTLPSLLAYLADIGNDRRYAPPPALPRGLLRRMYPHGCSPADLQDALDRHRYPRGKPLPACPVCEPDQADPTDRIARAVAALPEAQRESLVRLGQALALDGDAPDLAEQLAWVTGAQPVPPPYQRIISG